MEVAAGVVVDEDTWLPVAADHAARVDALTAGHRQRAGRGERHPVEDFLFTYYDLRVGALRRWHPGLGVVLAGPAARERQSWPGYEAAATPSGPGASPSAPAALARRGPELERARRLLRATAGRPARLGCFGMHEWAMVYGSGDVRHDGVPLRLGAAGTDAVLERVGLGCTHFDAFRFFSPGAAPRNPVALTRRAQAEHEQPGCVHATMDLYRWAYRAGPVVAGDLLLATFELARDARVLDMQASPYDLRGHGYEPVAVETPAGRAEYARRQRVLAERAAPLRRRLLAVLDAVCSSADAAAAADAATGG